MTAYDLFQAFDKVIALDDAASEPGLQRIMDCASTLRAKYYSAGTKTSEKITLIGSMAKATGIKPLQDADVLFHMPPLTYARFNDYTGNGQSALLQEVREALKQKYPRTDIRGDGPVVVVNFTDLPAVELVPGVLVPTEASILYADVYVPITRDGGKWEEVDYGDQLRALDATDGPVNGQLRRLIRYMKAWRQLTDASIKSIVLELMATDFMKSWDREQTSHTWDDWLVRDFLRYMVKNYASTYYVPGTSYTIGTGVGWFSDACDARDEAIEACRHEPNDFLYGYHWRKVLGDKFGR